MKPLLVISLLVLVSGAAPSSSSRSRRLTFLPSLNSEATEYQRLPCSKYQASDISTPRGYKRRPLKGCTCSVSQVPALSKITVSESPQLYVSEAPKFCAAQIPQFTVSQSPQFSVSESPQFSVSKTPQYYVPESPQFSVSKAPQFYVPKAPQFSVSESPQYYVSEAPQFSVSEAPQFSISKTPQFYVPKTPEFSVFETPQFSVSEAPQFYVSKAPEFSVSKTPQFYIPKTPQFYVPETPQFSVSETPQFYVPKAPEFSVSETPQFFASQTPQFSMSETPQFFASQTPQFSVSQTPQFSISETPQFYVPKAPQYSVSELPQIHVSQVPLPNITPKPEIIPIIMKPVSTVSTLQYSPGVKVQLEPTTSMRPFVQCFTKPKHRGRCSSITTSVPDLSPGNFNNRIQSLRQNGMWLYYEHTDYNTFLPGKVFYIVGLLSMNLPTNLRNTISSIRPIGGEDGEYGNMIISYQGPGFTGSQNSWLHNTPFMGDDTGRVFSIIVTGTSPWTIYTGESYTGRHVCVYADSSRSKAQPYVMGAYSNVTWLGLHTIMSVRKGCSTSSRVGPPSSTMQELGYNDYGYFGFVW